MSAQDVLVFVETQQDAVADIGLEMLGGARQLAAATGGQVVALLLGTDGSAQAPKLAAADRIVAINDPQLAAYAPGPYLAVLESVVQSEKPRALLIGSTSVGLDVGPALGARLDAPVVGGCQRIDAQNGRLKVTSSFCAGKMLADVEVDKQPAILLVLAGSFHPSTETRQPQVESRPSPVALEPGAIRFEELIRPAAGDVDITQQDVLVGVGRGIQQQDNLAMAEQLAQALGGQLCASRPIVDQGWLPTTRQVGKSGMTVKPKLYLALGISGAPEHEEGMKGSELVIAVNLDPKAPIFDFAHYGVQMDLLDLVPALTEAIKAKKR